MALNIQCVSRTSQIMVLCFVTVFSASCRDSTAMTRAVVGDYTLVSVNGGGLPAVVSQSQSVTVEIVSGQLTLNADGSFLASHLERTLTSTGESDVITSVNGDYLAVDGGYALRSITGDPIGLVSIVGNQIAGILAGRDYAWVRVA